MCVEAISIRPSLPLPLCPQVRFLHLRLHSFPTNSFISTFFLDSLSICSYRMFVIN